MWWHYETCVKAKQSREGVGAIGSMEKYLGSFAPQECASRVKLEGLL